MAITDKHKLVRIVEDQELVAAERRDEPLVGISFRVTPKGKDAGPYVLNVPVGRDAWLTEEEVEAMNTYLEGTPLPAGYALDKIKADEERSTRKSVLDAQDAALPEAHPNVVATEDASARASVVEAPVETEVTEK